MNKDICVSTALSSSPFGHGAPENTRCISLLNASTASCSYAHAISALTSPSAVQLKLRPSSQTLLKWPISTGRMYSLSLSGYSRHANSRPFRVSRAASGSAGTSAGSSAGPAEASSQASASALSSAASAVSKGSAGGSDAACTLSSAGASGAAASASATASGSAAAFSSSAMGA